MEGAFVQAWGTAAGLTPTDYISGFLHQDGNAYLFYAADGKIQVAIQHQEGGSIQTVQVTSGTEDTAPSAWHEVTGRVDVLFLRSGSAMVSQSNDAGLTWGAAVGTGINGMARVAVKYLAEQGALAVALITTDGDVKFLFVPQESGWAYTWTGGQVTVATGANASDVTVKREDTGRLSIFAIDSTGTLLHYKSDDLGATWAAV
jgi:hypothetical protein